MAPVKYQVQRHHQHEDPQDAEADHSQRQVTLGPLRRGRCRRGLLHVGDAPLDAADEVLAHLVERVSGADEHAADRDRTDDVLPQRHDHRAPGCLLVAAVRSHVLVDQAGTEEEHQQGHEETPREQAAGEVQRAKLRADDVPDAQVGWRDVGGRKRRHAAGRDLGGVVLQAKPHEALAELAHRQTELVLILEEAEARARHDADERPHSHGAEQLQRGLAPFLPGLVDLARRHGLRELQRGILDHHPAQDRHEHDAQQAAEDHERRRDQVLLPQMGGVELPQVEDDERRDGEDGARGHRLTNRADGPGEVLLEDGAALEQPEHRHADDGGRVSGGNRHPRAQSEVRVGRAQDDAHEQAQDERAQRELALIGRVGHVGHVATGRGTGGGSLVHSGGF